MNCMIQQLREQINSNNSNLSSQTKPDPPVSLTEIQKIEDELGCKLPDLLRSVYLDIGNGDFGQQFRLLPFVDLFTVHTRKNRRYLEALGISSWKRNYMMLL
ncbi:MAG: SMI1/KNR4 family protein [Roseiflexaceae bacterium]